MGFVKVKDHEWLDMGSGMILDCKRAPWNDAAFCLSVVCLLGFGSSYNFEFPTLEEAIEAQKRIIGSCEQSVSKEVVQHYYQMGKAAAVADYERSRKETTIIGDSMAVPCGTLVEKIKI